MTLYTDGDTTATEPEILSAASAIMQGRRKNTRNAGRKPALGKADAAAARAMLESGVSINRVARRYGVAWATIRRLK